jgi:GT2 family glycosyltransferase
MTEAPAISVIIPVFNRGYCLAATLRSVLAQTFTDFEVIVVDDGSTDDSAAVARSFGGRVQVFTQTNRGVSAARNTGLRAARGKWIAFLDSDDFWRPQKLERQLAALQKHGGVWCATQPVDQNGRPLFRIEEVKSVPAEPGIFFIPQPVELVVVATCHPYLQSMLVEKKLTQRAGWFAEELFGPEDTEYIFRLSQLSGMYFVDEPLTVVTQSNSDSLTRTIDLPARARFYEHSARAQEMICAGLPPNSPYKKSVRALAGFYHLLAAEVACATGDFSRARGQAGRGLAGGAWRDSVRCAAIWCCPGGMKKTYQKKWSSPPPAPPRSSP